MLLLTVHVIATVSLIGTDLVLFVLGVSGFRGADPRSVYPAASLVGTLLLQPLAIIALATGVLQVAVTSWGLFSYWWVVIKLTITAVLTTLVILVLVPALAALAHAATGLSPEAITSSQRLQIALVPSLAAMLLVVNVALGLFKPGWRLPSRAD
jgi:hypothetical protein